MLDLLGQKSQNQLCKKGVISEVIYQGSTWRVHFESSYWKAESLTPISLFPGDFVRVIGRQNITLMIEPISALSSVI